MLLVVPRLPLRLAVPFMPLFESNVGEGIPLALMREKKI